MEKLLLIGKGELFSSFVDYLFSNGNLSTDMITILPYDQFLNFQSEVKGKGNFHELSKLGTYKRLYLFPGNINEGMVLTSLISEWYAGILFVVTQDRECNFLYKKLGADYVIISKPHCKMYQWFPVQSKNVF